MNRILIYETDSREAVHLSQFLQTSGYAVATVTTTRQAISFAREYEFELFIINLSDPGETGYTTVAEIKCRPETARVGVLAIVPDASMVQAAQEAGCDVVLVRPFEAELLLRNLTEILERSTIPTNNIESMEEIPPSTVSSDFGRLSEALCQGVAWLETRMNDLGDQGPIAIESMRDAAINLHNRLEPQKVSPGSPLPDSVRDQHSRHDFRNLLAAVNGFSEILLLDDSIVEEVQVRLRELKKDSREFCTLLDEIRETAA